MCEEGKEKKEWKDIKTQPIKNYKQQECWIYSALQPSESQS